MHAQDLEQNLADKGALWKYRNVLAYFLCVFCVFIVMYVLSDIPSCLVNRIFWLDYCLLYNSFTEGVLYTERRFSGWLPAKNKCKVTMKGMTDRLLYGDHCVFLGHFALRPVRSAPELPFSDWRCEIFMPGRIDMIGGI